MMRLFLECAHMSCWFFLPLSLLRSLERNPLFAQSVYISNTRFNRLYLPSTRLDTTANKAWAVPWAHSIVEKYSKPTINTAWQVPWKSVGKLRHQVSFLLVTPRQRSDKVGERGGYGSRAPCWSWAETLGVRMCPWLTVWICCRSPNIPFCRWEPWGLLKITWSTHTRRTKALLTKCGKCEATKWKKIKCLQSIFLNPQLKRICSVVAWSVLWRSYTEFKFWLLHGVLVWPQSG